MLYQFSKAATRSRERIAAQMANPQKRRPFDPALSFITPRVWVLRDCWRGAARPGYPSRCAQTGRVLTYARFRGPLEYKERVFPRGQVSRSVRANWIVIGFVPPTGYEPLSFIKIVLGSFVPYGRATRQELTQAFIMLSSLPI